MDFTSKKHMGKQAICLSVLLLLFLVIQSGRDQPQQLWKDGDTKPVKQEVSRGNTQETIQEFQIEEVVSQLLSGSGSQLARQLWSNQLDHGIYRWEEVTTRYPNRRTYYVSSSVGSDNNSGTSPDFPKKTLEQYSGVSNVNVLLKSGDTFALSRSFLMGDNMLLASYGDGDRPLLWYYQELQVNWTRVPGYSQVWTANLSQVPGLYHGKEGQSDYNIGHLRIDGQENWKRASGEKAGAQYRQQAADGSFGIETETGTIYLHDTQDPNQRSIQYALPGTGIVLNKTQNASVIGLELTGAGFHGISMSDVANIQITGCYIHHIGGGYLNQSTSRYGNGVEIWNGGEQVSVTYNIAEWIYDTCYTNQSRGAGVVQKDINFYRNIGRYSFWGMESWGNKESGQEFDNINYEENILMYACDITAPQAKIYVNSKGENLDTTGAVNTDEVPYLSYRVNYYFHQMSLMMTSNASENRALTCSNNICWETNRYLCITGKSDPATEYSGFVNNFFYAELPTMDVAVFRTEDGSGRHYQTTFPFQDNEARLLQPGGDQKEKADAMEHLEQAVKKIANCS